MLPMIHWWSMIHTFLTELHLKEGYSLWLFIQRYWKSAIVLKKSLLLSDTDAHTLYPTGQKWQKSQGWAPTFCFHETGGMWMVRHQLLLFHIIPLWVQYLMDWKLWRSYPWLFLKVGEMFWWRSVFQRSSPPCSPCRWSLARALHHQSSHRPLHCSQGPTNLKR